MNEDFSVRSIKQLSQREVFHLLRGCLPEIKHHLKVMSSVEGVSMSRYVNNVLTQHFEQLKKGVLQ